MKLYSKYWLFILLFSLNVTVLYSQTKINGQLHLRNATPAIGAFISLVSLEDSISTIDFTIADNNGFWELNTSEEGVFFLRMAYVGYQEYLTKVNISLKDSQYFKIELKEEAVEIEEVEISAKAIDIIQKGDTLRYNVKNFMNGGESTLGDVLQKLPGFEIDEHQQIYYNGKKIDKLLIEGKDILNDQHSLANGINAKDLLGIDLIEHFKDKKDQFSGNTSDKIALNIDLDNKEKTLWSGSIEVGTGYKDKFQGNTNILGVGQKYGWTIFGKGNNTGQPVISWSEYFQLQSDRSLVRQVNQLTNGDLETLMPSSLTIPKSLQKNQDFLLAANAEYNLSKQLKFKSSILSSHLNRLSEKGFIRTYIDNTQTFTGRHQEYSTLPLLNIQSNFQYEWKEKNLI